MCAVIDSLHSHCKRQSSLMRCASMYLVHTILQLPMRCEEKKGVAKMENFSFRNRASKQICSYFQRFDVLISCQIKDVIRLIDLFLISQRELYCFCFSLGQFHWYHSVARNQFRSARERAPNEGKKNEEFSASSYNNNITQRLRMYAMLFTNVHHIPLCLRSNEYLEMSSAHFSCATALVVVFAAVFNLFCSRRQVALALLTISRRVHDSPST